MPGRVHGLARNRQPASAGRTLAIRQIPGGGVSIEAIDEVIDRLGTVVEEARAERSRIGYFAAMYRRVTVAVREAIVAGEFEDPVRMAQLDLVFAERYLDAYAAWRTGDAATESWQICFDAAGRWRPLILQHLLAGMSAHINLDLGVAAATVAPGGDLAELRNDFDTINDVLARLIDEFGEAVGSVSPWIRWLDRLGGRTDQAVMRFSIERARKSAWGLAEELAPLDLAVWPDVIGRRDEEASAVGRSVFRTGRIMSVVLRAIRLRETSNVRRVIAALE